MLSVLNNKKDIFFKKLENLSSYNYFTNTYGFSRSLLALGVIINLIFNSKETLFLEYSYNLDSSLLFKKINLFNLFEYEYLVYSKLIAILILLICILGYYPRYFGILQWWVSFSYLNQVIIVEGGDHIANNVLLLLIPITLLDSRKNHWNKGKYNGPYVNFVAFIFFFLISLQVSILYLQAATDKIYKLNEWVEGTAIYYWFNNSVFGIPDYIHFLIDPFLTIPLISFILCWGVIVFELILFASFFMNYKNKKRIFNLAVLFHLIIAFLFGLWAFSIIMISMLILFLYPKQKTINFKKQKKYGL